MNDSELQMIVSCKRCTLLIFLPMFTYAHDTGFYMGKGICAKFVISDKLLSFA